MPETAAELTLLAEDARSCGASERGTYAAANVGALVPRRLWRPAQGLAILSASGLNGPESHGVRLQVSASTRVDFVFASYSLVLALDVSPSMAGLDAHEAAVAGAGGALNAALAEYLAGVSAPVLSTPPAALSAAGPMPPFVFFAPEVFLSVVTGGGRRPPRLLLHGRSLTTATLPSLLSDIRSRLSDTNAEGGYDNDCLGFSNNRERCDNGSGERGGLAPLLEASACVLRLLPSHSLPAVVLVSDCVGRLPDSTVYDGSLIWEMARHDMAVSVLHVGSCSGVHAALGAVPDSDGHCFLAQATGGFRMRHRDLAAFCAPPAELQSLLLALQGRKNGVGSGSGVVFGAGIDGSGAVSSQTAPPFSTACWSPLQRATFVRTAAAAAVAAASPITKAFLAGGGGGASRVSPSAQQLQVPPPAAEALGSEGAAQMLLFARAASPADFAFPWRGPPPPAVLRRVTLTRYRLPLGALAVLEARLKEGFRLLPGGAESSAATGASTAQFTRLLLPWQPDVLILYALAPRAGGTVLVRVDAVARPDFALLVESATAGAPPNPVLSSGGALVGGSRGGSHASGGGRRLSPEAADVHQAHALRAFVAAMRQVDDVLSFLCNQPAATVPLPSDDLSAPIDVAAAAVATATSTPAPALAGAASLGAQTLRAQIARAAAEAAPPGNPSLAPMLCSQGLFLVRSFPADSDSAAGEFPRPSDRHANIASLLSMRSVGSAGAPRAADGLGAASGSLPLFLPTQDAVDARSDLMERSQEPRAMGILTSLPVYTSSLLAFGGGSSVGSAAIGANDALAFTEVPLLRYDALIADKHEMLFLPAPSHAHIALVNSNESRLAAAVCGEPRAAAAPAAAVGTTSSAKVAAMSLQQLLFFSPLASMSVAAWHRFFDVERVEVGISLPPAATAAIFGDTIAVESSGSGLAPLMQQWQAWDRAGAASAVGAAVTAAGAELTRRLPSLLHRAVSKSLRKWADAELPAAADVFSPAGAATRNFATVSGNNGSAFVKLLGLPQRLAEPDDASRSFAEPEVDAAGRTSPPTFASGETVWWQPPGVDGYENGFFFVGEKSAAVPPVTAPATSSLPAAQQLPRQPPVRIGGQQQPFVLVRVQSPTQTLGSPSGSNICTLHLAYFACSPPERAAAASELTLALSREEALLAPVTVVSGVASEAVPALLACSAAVRVLETRLGQLAPAPRSSSAVAPSDVPLFGEQAAVDTLCCGGAPIPQPLLNSLLLRQRWRYRLPSAPMCSHLAAFGAIVRARVAVPPLAGAPAQLGAWQMSRWMVDTCVPAGGVLARAHLFRLASLERPPPPAVAVVFALSQPGVRDNTCAGPQDEPANTAAPCAQLYAYGTGAPPVAMQQLELSLVSAAAQKDAMPSIAVTLYSEPRGRAAFARELAAALASEDSITLRDSFSRSLPQTAKAGLEK